MMLASIGRGEGSAWRTGRSELGERGEGSEGQGRMRGEWVAEEVAGGGEVGAKEGEGGGVQGWGPSSESLEVRKKELSLVQTRRSARKSRIEKSQGAPDCAVTLDKIPPPPLYHVEDPEDAESVVVDGVEESRGRKWEGVA